MKSLLYALSLLFILLSSYSFSEEEEIRVHLSTESPLSPLYFGRIHSPDKSLDDKYLIHLELVLENDLSHNAKTRIMPRDPVKETLLENRDRSEAFIPSKWKQWAIAHVMQGEIKDKKLEIRVFSTSNLSLKTFPEIPLTGTLSIDRKLIHKLSDALLRALFDEEGICSTKILYSFQPNSTEGGEGNWKAEIWECDWDGSNAHQVTKDNSYNVTPVATSCGVSPTGDKFFYVSYKLGQPKIFLGSFKDGSSKKVIDLRGNQLLPALSPKKDKIAYVCDASGRADLFIQMISDTSHELGKPHQLFSFPRSSQGSPTFSPDGKKIAFVSDKDGSPRIYVIPASFSERRPNPTLITKQNKESSCPSWSPDGKKLAYSSKTNGIRQIWIYDFEADEERQLTTGPGNKENPSWAPNSTHLVFNSTDNQSSDLYVVNIYQPEAIKITKGPGKKHYPSWTARKD